MIEINEVNQRRRKYLVKTVKRSNGSIISTEIIDYLISNIKKDSKTYFMLIGDNGPVKDVTRYINIALGNKAENTRSQAIHNLRKLYLFRDLIGKDFASWEAAEIANLVRYLRKLAPAGGDYIINYTPEPVSNNTVNETLSTCRGYFSFLNIICPALSDSHVIHDRFGNLIENRPVRRTKYDSSLSTGTPSLVVPMYISVDDFKRILDVVRSDKDCQAEIIIRLMYCLGMRIGEVLGLTTEDITLKKIDGVYKPVIYLCNRVSDNKKEQSAKSEMKALSKAVYHNIKRDRNYIPLTESLYDFIMEFVEHKLDNAAEKGKLKNAAADSVLGQKIPEPNYYIFLNRIYKPMTSRSWNNYLHKVYERAGIHVDKKVRQHNLNHRFRHGFAMFQIIYNKLDAVKLKVLMRHKSISSVMIYFRPTEADTYNIKTEFVESLLKEIPALSEFPDIWENDENQ